MICKKDINNALRNCIGFSTSRKIVVIESDDWGSVRMFNAEAITKMRKAGLPVDKSQFTRFDSLESNTDLELLFDVLRSHKDSTGRPPVITPLCVVANPNFDAIKASDFKHYVYEVLPESCKSYSNHDRVVALWQQGVKERLFYPQYHGREHLNPQRWLRALSSGDKTLNFMFDLKSFGLARGFNNEIVPIHLPAFDSEFPSDIEQIYAAAKDGLEIFKSILGYNARYFVPSNSAAINGIAQILSEKGIEYIYGGRCEKIPQGDGSYRISIKWLGRENEFGQTIITRNCFFEPVGAVPKVNWVDYTMREIDNAFFFHKPAVISTHRVNYVGHINTENREKGLDGLNILLNKIIQKYPQVEFLTSTELGDIITKRL